MASSVIVIIMKSLPLISNYLPFILKTELPFELPLELLAPVIPLALLFNLGLVGTCGKYPVASPANTLG